MTTANPAGEKICARCGRDCSNRRRLKDHHGRYFCAECAAEADTSRKAVDPLPLADDQPPVSTISNAPPTIEPIPLADDPIPRVPAEPAPPPPSSPPRSTQRCPECGYDLRGLKKPQCPECGLLLTRSVLRRMHDEKIARETVRSAYLRPAIIFAVFAALLGGTLIYRYGSDGLLALLAGIPGGTIAATITYILCGFLFLGFDAPLRLVVVQIAAVVAGTSFTYAIMGWLPSILLAHFVPAIICVFMMHSELDLDIQDAAFTGIPAAFAMYGVWWVVALYIL